MKPAIQLLYHGNIFTQDAGKAVSALAIQSGRIIAAGSDKSLMAEFGDQAIAEDLHGKTILPGFTDAHIHLMQYALSLQKVDCETPTRSECLERVAQRARLARPGAWILGHGWNQNEWAEGFGNAGDLDAIAPDNPVYLTAKSLHAGWANSTALRQAGLLDTTPDPQDGRLGRDRAGRLDGILFETAMDLVARAIPEPGLEELVQVIEAALPNLWRVGLTGAHDFDRSRCFAALQVLDERSKLQLRVTKSIPLEDLEQAIAVGLRTGFGNDFLRIGAVKAFADGALGPHTAAMLQPYEDDISNRGILMLDGETLYEYARQAARNGLSMAVHAIGDRANHEVLAAYSNLRKYEKANRLNNGRLLRHRIEHVQVIHSDDISRLAELDIIASMQPIHATSDMRMADLYWGDRAALAYAWRTQIQQGARLAFGSDAPVESPNPFWGLHAAVTRQRLDGSPGSEGWYPEQRLTLAEAIAAYTTGAAYTAHMEDRLGRLAPGYYADLIMLEADPFTCAAEELAQLSPCATMISGEWVYRK